MPLVKVKNEDKVHHFTSELNEGGERKLFDMNESH